ncbi:hypothetical protein QBC44DRAFT_315287 [Cladorrhinum sp. PSN332]|nr:hypothetical protein QBC44DRAFT_315287 [Cladorrhinum sp. PSN332]
MPLRTCSTSPTRTWTIWCICPAQARCLLLSLCTEHTVISSRKLVEGQEPVLRTDASGMPPSMMQEKVVFNICMPQATICRD